MNEQEELELAFRAAVAPRQAPEGFALRVMTKIANPADSSSQTYGATHFAWVVTPGRKKKAPLWNKVFRSFTERQEGNLSLGLCESDTTRAEHRSWQPLTSALIHVVVILCALLLTIRGSRQTLVLKAIPTSEATEIDLSHVAPPIGNKPLSGGGGGGAHQALPASAGKPPIVKKTPMEVPLIHSDTTPKLALQSSIRMPVLTEDSSLPNIGMPTAKAVILASAGSGAGGGVGSGTGGGLGSGRGSGVGEGEGGGYGGGVYHIGNGVSAPVLVRFVDPEFSDEARRAKYQGICIVSLVVDKDGRPREIRVSRKLGMGLDEKAIDAVRQYRFRPATLKGAPVAVAISVQVDFHIY